MTNDSSTGGYLAPTETPAPLEGQALLDFLQAVLVGISGLPGTLVRPRWQTVAPNQPPLDVDWLAFGIQERPADTYAFEIHDPGASDGNGADIMSRNERLDILCSFYGPAADSVAARVRDGFSVPQNRDALLLAGMVFVECGNIRAAPALINQQWYSRMDMLVSVRRAVTRVYPVLHIETAGITLNTDVGITENIEVMENL